MLLQMKYLLLALWFFSAVATADQDEDFLVAREAYRADDGVRLEKIAERFKSTPLEPYITYYQLRLRLYERNPEGVKEFLARPDDTPVIDQLRSEWLKWQAKQQRWDAFAADYPRLLEADDEMKCYARAGKKTWFRRLPGRRPAAAGRETEERCWGAMS